MSRELAHARALWRGIPFSRYLPDILVMGALLLLNVFIYGQSREFAFINYDDPGYVSGNEHVLSGLTWQGVHWAFTSVERANWHPMTWLSLMLDAEFFGTWPGAYHLTNVALHFLNGVLLFRWLRVAAGAFWPAAATALVFVAHPLHVESVAWVTERKDVLSTFFLLLTLIAYTRYARRGGWTAYGVALVAYALGLMAKPMLVTIPMLLLLLDFWPLRRLTLGNADCAATDPVGTGDRPGGAMVSARGLLLEKAPFALLAAASCLITSLVQQHAAVTLRGFPFGWRLVNAVSSYGEYLSKTVWPVGLAIPYPFADAPPWSEFAAGAVLLGICTAAAVLTWRSRPCLMVGWLWFVGTLVPVIGLVQVGNQSMADRYTYVPHIGLFTALAYLAFEGFPARPVRRVLAAAAFIAGTAALALVSRQQASYWRNSVTLFSHSLEVTGPNALGFKLLGSSYLTAGQPGLSRKCYEAALRLQPDNLDDLARLGFVCVLEGDYEAALAPLERVVKCDPAAADSRHYLALALRRSSLAYSTSSDANLRDGGKALTLARRALELPGIPSNPGSGLYCVASAYAEMGQWPAAEAAAAKLVECTNESADASASTREEASRLQATVRAHRPLRR